MRSPSRDTGPSVAVVGDGAMGGLFAARLARVGVPVSILEVDPETVEAINASGVTVDRGDAFVARPAATTDASHLHPADVVFFFVKSQHTASAARSAGALAGEDSTIVTLQNGWGNADVLAGVFPRERIVVGVTYHSATVVARGHVAHTGSGVTFVGPLGCEATIERSTDVARLLQRAGFETTATAVVRAEIWRKLVLNAAVLPIGALTGLRAIELAQPGGLLALIDLVAAEAITVAVALGHPVDLAERLERIHATLRGAGMGKPSMLQDVEARRRTEIATINGAVVSAADELGIEVPLNRALVALIEGLERSWQR